MIRNGRQLSGAGKPAISPCGARAGTLRRSIATVPAARVPLWVGDAGILIVNHSLQFRGRLVGPMRAPGRGLSIVDAQRRSPFSRLPRSNVDGAKVGDFPSRRRSRRPTLPREAGPRRYPQHRHPMTVAQIERAFYISVIDSPAPQPLRAGLGRYCALRRGPRPWPPSRLTRPSSQRQRQRRPSHNLPPRQLRLRPPDPSVRR